MTGLSCVDAAGCDAGSCVGRRWRSHLLLVGELKKRVLAVLGLAGRVIRAGGVPNIRETKAYVAAIMGRLANHSRVEIAQ